MVHLPAVSTASPTLVYRCAFIAGLALTAACGPTVGDTSETAPIQPASAAVAPDGVAAVTGGHTRAVWIQDQGDGTDILGFGNQVTIVGFDSDDGQGERAIVAAAGTFAKPLFTRNGDRIIYADRTNDAVRVVGFDGTDDRRVTTGFPLATWIDPEIGIEWVYVGTAPQGTDPESYGQVHRHQIDQPDQTELVWDRRSVSGDSFQVSRDGRLAGALARWPEAGLLELPNGEWHPLGEGCWTSLAADDSGLFWYFDGQHRNLTIVDNDADDRWTVNINSAPGIDGFEVYHPRWSNHPRFLVMTGPYTEGGGGNKIRGGGQGVEIHLGRFSADHRRVEAWTRISTNDVADFYPDVWIAPDVAVPSSPTTAAGEGVVDATADAPIVVEVRVTQSVPLPSPADIAPYRNGLLVLEYDVVEIIEGAYSEDTVLAAHWIIADGETLVAARRPAGTTLRLRLEPYTAHPELEGERLVMNSDRFDLPLLYDVASDPR